MRIAVAQLPGARLDQWQATLALIDDLVARAADMQAELVVLPECAWPAYFLGSRAAYFAARRDGLPGSDDFLQHLARHARTSHLAICAGYVEESGGRVANAACLLDADGTLLGVHRKCFLWDFDHDFFDPGECIEPIGAPWGSTGVMICADARLPEIPATLAARGAHLILQPTAWVNAGAGGQLWNPQPEFLIAARASEFGVPIACASKWGVEGATTFVGSSRIFDADGNVLAACDQAETAIVAADVKPGPPRQPVLTDAERAVLCAATVPTRAADAAARLEVVPLPGDLPPQQYVKYVSSRPGTHDATLGIISAQQRIGPPATTIRDDLVLLQGPVGGVLQCGQMRVASVDAADILRFAPVRTLALQGVHVVAVFGREIPTQWLRARACENRVWILGIEPARLTVVEPRGGVVSVEAWPDRHAERRGITLDASAAHCKLAAPRTDVLAGRRPSQYAY